MDVDYVRQIGSGKVGSDSAARLVRDLSQAASYYL